MVLFLTSLLKTHYYSDDGARVTVAPDDENGILSNIRKYLKRTERLVVVANNQYDSVDNDEKLAVVCESFARAGLNFKEYVALDARNKKCARDIVSGADMIILSGGKCVCQAEFFEEIGLKDILKSFGGVVIGISAGSMNLCKTVANFPEELSDIAELRWLSGMGFYDGIIIPHFDGETNSYQFPCEQFDIAKEYILPMSNEREFIGLPNGAYIVIESDGREKRFGDIYSIKNGKSVKL